MSFPAGKILGVDLRIHISFPLLLALAVGYSTIVANNAARGFGLWFALCFAVLVREIARAIAGAYLGLRLRALFLLPVGGVMAFSPRSGEPAKTGLITAAAPIANFVVGALMLGFCYAFQPGLHLFDQPWITIHHVLRSFIWTQFVIGIIGLLPSALPSKPALAAAGNQPNGKRAGIPGFSLTSALAVAVVLGGMAVMNLWIILLGAFMFLGSQLSTSQQPLQSPEAEAIRVRDVMLTEYTLLSTSDTLASALQQTVHSLQDVFPVVRGDRLVGSVARGTLIQNLQMQGDGYLQGVMTRSLQTASPDEKLIDALRRSAALGASEFIPVVEDGGMLGILTPQSLSRSVQLVKPVRAQRPVQE